MVESERLDESDKLAESAKSEIPEKSKEANKSSGTLDSEVIQKLKELFDVEEYKFN
ncbi:MAG TPA: hypothetical protein PKD83_02580 [Ignavibacteria bacterium]|nr:hypothetical protein [Ignavibacteria bacterium]